MARILIIDDDVDFRTTLAATLTSMGHKVDIAGDGQAGLRALDEPGYALAFLDYRMPGMDGLSVLRSRDRDGTVESVPIVMLTAHSSSDNTIDAMKHGAFDHLAKPIGRSDLARVIERATLEGRSSPPVTAMEPSVDIDALIGSSAPMRAVQKLIGMAAASDAPVLIEGETGTGKEVVARALHRASGRADGSFVAVNCAAIPAELMESELFGHGKGAFTGAVADRKGHFREADGGTLFLDEIGDMPLAMQAKLLRALQEREVVPLGTSRPVSVDVRVIAATHRDLARFVADGQFRTDLLYRLDVLAIRLAPLRQRPEDIPALVKQFLAGRKGITLDALDVLSAYPWPGNVRQLRNAVERGVALARGYVIGEHDLHAMLPAVAASTLDRSTEDALSMPAAVERLEQQMIRDALDAAQGNRAEAARRLGIRRQLLYRKLADYRIE